jgi:hypothetical protein
MIDKTTARGGDPRLAFPDIKVFRSAKEARPGKLGRGWAFSPMAYFPHPAYQHWQEIAGSSRVCGVLCRNDADEVHPTPILMIEDLAMENELLMSRPRKSTRSLKLENGVVRIAVPFRNFIMSRYCQPQQAVSAGHSSRGATALTSKASTAAFAPLSNSSSCC